MTDKQIKKELSRQALLFEEGVKTGQFMNGHIKFEAFAEQWFKQIELEGNLKPLTIDKYKKMKERTYKAIGHLKMTEINRVHIQRFINSLAEEGTNKLTNGGLPKRKKAIWDLFLMCLTMRFLVISFLLILAVM